MALGIVEPKTRERPPGTELLVDDDDDEDAQRDQHHVQGIMRLKHGMGKKGDIILIPQPSDDPNDPLLWPTWKRESAFFFLFLNCIVFAACPGPMIAPATVALASQLHVPIKHVAQLSGYQLLIVGALGPLVSVLARKYGKRPQFLIASVVGVVGTGICVASFDRASLKTSYRVLLAGRMVQGIGTTAYESLSVAAIGDMFFLHERGLRCALLVLTLASMSSFIAVVAGTLCENLGARMLFVVLLPFQAVAAVGTGLFVPEMQFRRQELRQVGIPPDEKKLASGKKHEDVALSQDTIPRSVNPTTSTTRTARRPTDPSNPRRTFRQDLSVSSGTYSQASIPTLLGSIFIHLLNPAVLWIQIVSAVLVSFFVGTAYTLAQTFTPPPYRLSVAQNGYFFAGALVGGVLGISSGPLCDFIARRLARRNKGVFEAEFRIPICIVAVVVFAVGWFVFGWALDEGRKGAAERTIAPGRIVVVCSVCYGCVCFATSVASTGAGLYVLDAFPAHATEIFILQMMFKNFLFYAFSSFINDFAARKGPAHMARVFGIATLAGFTTCVPMYVFGKVNRAAMLRWRGKRAG